MDVLWILLAAITLVMLPFEAPALRKRAAQQKLQINWLIAFVLALLNIVLSLVLAAATFYGVLFGPSHLTGDFTGLPWLTMLPAIGVGFLVAKLTSATILRLAFGWLADRRKRGQVHFDG
ncbi:MAG TPA: hypothetical protein VGC74_02995 [Stenotrophomonas sp.]|jgi:hypothetical protein